MVRQEPFKTLPDGTELVRTFSDKGKFIRKEGTLDIYEEAIDAVPVPYEYEETDKDIEPPEEEQPEGSEQEEI